MITSILNTIGTIVLVVAIFLIVAYMVVDESDFDIQEYLEERQRQKTARELARIQRQREALGTIDDQRLFENEDVSIEDLIRPETEGSNNGEHTTEDDGGSDNKYDDTDTTVTTLTEQN